MIDFSTNVIHGYDGNLATPIPRPIGLCDDLQNRVTPTMIQSMMSNYRISTEIVWTLLFVTGFVFDTAQFLNDDHELHEVFANIPPPFDTVTAHMNIYAYAEKVCLAPGFVSMILDPDREERDPYATILELFRIAKVSPSIMSAGAYKRLLGIIGNIIARETVGHDSADGYIDQKLSGDMRYLRPIFRRISPLHGAIDPGPDDPAIISGIPRIVDEMYEEMFEYGLNMLLNPRSAISRIGVGFAIIQVTSEDVNFSDVFVDPGWQRINLVATSFLITLQGGLPVVKLRINGEDYGDYRNLPQTLFTIENPGLFAPNQIAFLLNGVRYRRLGLLFPRVRYLYTIHTTDRAGFADYTRDMRLDDLVRSVASSVVHLPLYSTVELVSSGLKQVIGQCEKYVFPITAPNVTISVANMYGMVQHHLYQPPRPSLYETGYLNADWRNTLENGVQKTFSTIYMANEIIVREKRPHLYGLPTLQYRMPDELAVDAFVV